MKKLLTLLSAVALAGPAAAQVKIGFVNSITGPEAPIGENLTNGVKLAEEDLKAQGQSVQILMEDDTGKPDKAMGAVEKLALAGVAGVVGPYTSASANAAAKVAQRSKVPLLVPVAAKEDITKQGLGFVFRLNAPADQYARALVDAVLAVDKPKSIAFIYENTDFGTSTTKTAKEYAAAKGLQVVADEAYSKGSPDYRSTLTKVKATAPDLVFMVSYVADAILLMRQAKEIGLAPKAFLGGGAGFTTVQFAAEKEISGGVMAATQWTEDVTWPGARAFFDRYKAKFGKEPTYHAACAYEAMRIMAKAALQAAGNPMKTRAALAEYKGTGIMGDVDFEDYDGFTNQNRHQMLVQQIQQGQYETVFPPQFSTKKVVYPFPGWK